MPHSSGGGSHSSGSHHSSSFSHSSSSSSSSGNSGPVISRTYFQGARRFVYYKHKKPVYVYSTEDLTALEKPSPLRFLYLIFFLPFFAFGIFALLHSFTKAEKLEMNYNPTTVTIEDNMDLFDQTEEETLLNTLTKFQDMTGITPVVTTTQNESWKQYYDNLEIYAYDWYVNKYSDEKHWVIVISVPGNPDENFEDWYFEGMQGNDTDSIITQEVADHFTDVLNENLFASTRFTKGQAVDDAFKAIMPNLMKGHLDPFFFGFSIAWLLFTGFGCYSMAFHDPQKKLRKAMLCPQDYDGVAEIMLERICGYCSNIYVRGIHLKCPHCGAPLPLETEVPESNFVDYRYTSS